MGKLKILIALFSLFLVSSIFQNCGKQSKTQNEQGAGDFSYNRVSTAGYSKLNVDDSMLVDEQLYNSKAASDEPLIYEIDTDKTTVYVRMRDGRSAGEMHTMDAADMSNLKSLLASAEICEPVANPHLDSDVACTMIYEYPYVELINGGDVKKLGEVRSGCDIPVDFCDDKGSEIKQAFVAIINKIKKSPY